MMIKNPTTRHYFKCGIKKNSKLIITGTVFHLLSAPALLLSLLIREITTGNISSTLLYSVFAVVFFCVAVFEGVVIGVNNFSYLHKKQETDTYFSFPLSAKQRFFCDYLSGLFSYLAPAVVSAAASSILSGILSIMDYSDYSVFHCGERYSLFTVSITLSITAIVIMAMLYTITVLSSVLCGTKSESYMNCGIINGLIPGMITLLSYICFNKAPGLNTFKACLPVFDKSSPFGAVYGFFHSISYEYRNVFALGDLLIFLFWIIAFTALYVFLSYKIYTKRKAEQTSKPYPFKLYYNILITCVTFAILSVIPSFYEIYFIPFVILAIVFYLSFEVISKRGFKGISKSFLRCGLTIGGCLALICILNNNWCFGAANRIPDAEDVKAIYISGDYDAAFGDKEDCFKVTSDEGIEAVLVFHSDCLEYDNLIHDEGPLEYYDNYTYFGYSKLKNTIYVKYELKNGLTMERELHIYDDNKFVINTLEQLQASEDYADFAVKCIKEKYTSETNSEYGSSKYKFYATSLSHEYNTLGLDISANQMNGNEYSHMPEEYFMQFIDALCDAVRQDVINRDASKINTNLPLYHFHLGNNEYFYIYSFDYNILSVLYKYSNVK